MKPMFAAFAAIVVIAFGAWFVLGQAGFSARDAAAGKNVRLD